MALAGVMALVPSAPTPMRLPVMALPSPSPRIHTPMCSAPITLPAMVLAPLRTICTPAQVATRLLPPRVVPM